MSRTTVACAILIAVVSLAASAHSKRRSRSRIRSGLRRSGAGAHFVSVDAYPTRDGKPITGLTINDFELLEDGKPQVIDRIEFIEHQEWTPLAERRDPNSQRDGFELAAESQLPRLRPLPRCVPRRLRRRSPRCRCRSPTCSTG